jgi:hypothetical protein
MSYFNGEKDPNHRPPVMDKVNFIDDLVEAILENPEGWDMLEGAVRMYLVEWPEDEQDDLLQVAKDFGIEPSSYFDEAS